MGCMRRLKIQGRTIDPLVMVQSKQAVGVVLDGCDLKDRCKGLKLCEHDSVCVSDWEGVVCDCARVPYVGKTCHFGKSQKFRGMLPVFCWEFTAINVTVFMWLFKQISAFTF